MRITFLGTSAGMPTTERNVSAVILAIDDAKSWYLVDCGEATQHQLLHCRYTLKHLRAVFITHVHGDHLYGLPGLIASAAMQGRTAPLMICAPKGVQPFVEQALHHSSMTDIPFALEFVRSDYTDFHYQDNQVTVTAHGLSHRVPSFAYRFSECTQPTALDIDKLHRLKVPQGELWGQLQRGEVIQWTDGLQINPADVLLPAPVPRVVIIAGDNDQPERLIKALQGTHLLIHEATYDHALWQQGGKEWMHSSARMVASMAEQCQLPNLILTHFSGRYQKPSQLAVLEDEARAVFAGTLGMAADLSVWEIDRHGVMHRLT